mgnify:CR=1 FL=1|jgi:hypothetical protein
MKNNNKNQRIKIKEKLDDLYELKALGKSGLKIRKEEMSIINSQIFKLGKRLQNQSSVKKNKTKSCHL